MDETAADTEPLNEEKKDPPGLLLRRAREEKGMSIGDVAEVTRVAQRQLEAIERSDFSELPGTPYAVGFARAFARAVGADEVEVARGVREELGAVDHGRRYEAFEPVDPARIPPTNLAWIAAAVALILAVGYGVWRTQFFTASTDQEISDISNRASSEQVNQAELTAAQLAKAPPKVSDGPVVLTALGDVWLRIYDQSGNRLFEKQMAKGESYTVPPQADDPMILTGRPDAIAVTVGGKPVASLGPADRTISDVPISAAALLARSPAPESSQQTTPAPRSLPTASVPLNSPREPTVSVNPTTAPQKTPAVVRPSAETPSTQAAHGPASDQRSPQAENAGEHVTARPARQPAVQSTN